MSFAGANSFARVGRFGSHTKVGFMDLKDSLNHELARLVGYASTSTKTVTLPGPNQLHVALDFTAVDSMSCSLAEIRVLAPSLSAAGPKVLKEWAEALSRRITYLLEHIGPLEFSTDQGQVLIRSNPPDKQAGVTQFYEILLQSHAGGKFTLRRYRSEKGALGRKAVDIQVTHEVLHKLINDLVETIPQKS